MVAHNPKVRWTPTVHDLAKRELLNLKAEQPTWFASIQAHMALLAQERDPRRPANPCLDVCEVRYDAPGWYRLKIREYNLRVVFRLLQQRGSTIVEIHAYQRFDPYSDARAIQITLAQRRGNDTYLHTRERSRKVRG